MTYINTPACLCYRLRVYSLITLKFYNYACLKFSCLLETPFIFALNLPPKYIRLHLLAWLRLALPTIHFLWWGIGDKKAIKNGKPAGNSLVFYYI